MVMTPCPAEPRIWPISRLESKKWRRRLKEQLLAGAVIAYPTDTLYGMGGDFLNPAVHRRINAIKGREDKPYSVALWSPDAIKGLAIAPSSRIFSKLVQLLPGPFTLVLPAAPTLDRDLLFAAETIGIRVPGPPFPREAMAEIQVPLISTSINHSGCVPLADPARILAEFPQIAVIIDAGTLPPSSGSTIVDFSVSPPAILRRGDGMARLQEFKSW